MRGLIGGMGFVWFWFGKLDIDVVSICWGRLRSFDRCLMFFWVVVVWL